jgi:hypothetical protein
MSTRAALGGSAALALAACALASQNPAVQPAILVAADAAARAELVAAITRELRAPADVRLADDAFEHSSEITIDRMMPRDADGHPLDGRERGRPEHFQLWLVDGHCVLEHQGGTRVKLMRARCARAPG